MAHGITRIEGFEGGPSGTANVFFDGVQGSAFSVQSTIVRSGEYALRVNPPATASTHAVQIGASWNAVGDRIDTTDYNASCWRIPIYVKDAYPAATTRIITLLTALTAAVVTIDMTSAGLLVLDGVTGTTPIALNTWTVVEIKKDGTAPLRELRIEGAVELSNATAGSGINRVVLGKFTSTSSAAYDIYFDDIMIEAAALIASIDYPEALVIRRLDVDGDGFYDGVWTASTGADAWQSVDLLEDGNTSYILSPAGASAQTFTLESTAQAGISPSAIHGVQFSTVQKRTATIGSNTRMRLRSGGADNEITALNSLSASYAHYANLRLLSPFTAAVWTTAELDALEFGLTNTASANTVRCTCLFAQVAYLAAVVEPSLPESLPASLPSVVSAAPIFCAAVIFDPGGAQEYDLSGRLVSMRPLRQERDIQAFGYRASDVDLDFTDVDGLLIPENVDSPLRDAAGEVNWYGKKVLVVGLFGSTVLTRFVGYLQKVRNERGISSFQIANRFQYFAEKKVLANQMGKVVAADGAVGVYPHIRPTGTRFVWGVRVHTTNSSNARPCKVETWTFTFTSTTDWYVVGSETGFDGVGSVNDGGWISNSGSIMILQFFAPFNFVGWGSGPFAAGDQVQVTTVYRAPIANERVDPAFAIGQTGNTANGTGQALADMLKAFLLSPQGGGATVGAAWPEPFALSAADLDPSIDALSGTSQDQPVVSYVVDSQKSVLDVIDEMALHLGVTIAEKSNGMIGAVSMFPRVVAASVPRDLCKSEHLMAASLDHFEIQNEFLLAYDYDQTRSSFNRAFHHPRLQGWPAVANENDSFTKYGRLLPASRVFELRAFEHANGNSWWVETIAGLYYTRLKEPRRTMAVKAKIALLDADLDQIFYVDSEAPDITGFFEPYAIGKNLTGDLVTEMEMASLEGLLQVGTAECGYLSYDTPGQGYDQCWGYL